MIPVKYRNKIRKEQEIETITKQKLKEKEDELVIYTKRLKSLEIGRGGGI